MKTFENIQLEKIAVFERIGDAKIGTVMLAYLELPSSGAPALAVAMRAMKAPPTAPEMDGIVFLS